MARSTTPLCIRGALYSISMFRFLQNSRYSFEIKAHPLSDFIFSGIPYKLKLLVNNCITFFVSAVLQIFTFGHLLNLSCLSQLVSERLRVSFGYAVFR